MEEIEWIEKLDEQISDAKNIKSLEGKVFQSTSRKLNLNWKDVEGTDFDRTLGSEKNTCFSWLDNHFLTGSTIFCGL